MKKNKTSKVDRAIDAKVKKANKAKAPVKPVEPKMEEALAAQADKQVDKTPAAPVVVEVKTKGALGEWLGFSVISVMRAMGAAGWDYKRVLAAVQKAGKEAKERTIRGAIRRGKKGEKKIAVLTAEQLAELDAQVPTPAVTEQKQAA